DRTLQQMQQVISALSAQGKPADSMRQNEWLASWRSRLVIPGGVCEFDMPSYYALQNRSVQARAADLQHWCQPLLPLYDGLLLALQLMRRNCETMSLVARNGIYQESPEGKVYQLLRVYLPDDLRVFPEISANKYSISIRFSSQEGHDK